MLGPRSKRWLCLAIKDRPRALAQKCGVPVLPGTSGPTSVDEAKEFLASLGADGAVMIKSLAGGGGRGMRAVQAVDDLEAAYARCQSEATAAFGNGDVYVEQLLPVHGILRSRSLGTGPVRSVILVSVSAASSAATRSWWKSLRRPGCRLRSESA